MTITDEQLALVRDHLLAMHNDIRDGVVRACEEQSVAALSSVAEEDEGDTIFEIDRVSEALLVEQVGALSQKLGKPIILVGEGLPNGKVILPETANEKDALLRIIVDPIDGTRCIMTQKRPAWILTGVAPNLGENTTLQNIILALQTELPLVKQHLCDQFWAAADGNVQATRTNRLTGESQPLHVHPSTSDTFEHGCVSIARFFPGARDVLAAIDDELAAALLGPPQHDKALCFEDQYPSTGGQLCELFSGRDRFIADLRPLLKRKLLDRGQVSGLCCHPYDLSTMLIAKQAGVVLTDPSGNPLDAPLDTKTDVAWVGYANETLKQKVQPLLTDILRRHELID